MEPTRHMRCGRSACGPCVDDDGALILQPQDLDGRKRRQWRQLRYVGCALPLRSTSCAKYSGAAGSCRSGGVRNSSLVRASKA